MKKNSPSGRDRVDVINSCDDHPSNEVVPGLTSKALRPEPRQSRPGTGHGPIAVLLLFAFFVIFEAAVICTQLLLHMPGFSGCLRALAIVVLLPLPLWLSLANLMTAPLLRVLGVLKYYSPMFLVTTNSSGHIYLHGATLFDYALHMRWRDRGSKARRKTLGWYLEGLLALIRDIESGKVPKTTSISGTSYFFSTRCARKLGFSVEESRWLAFGGFLTYPSHFLTYSLAKGRWAFPNVLAAKRASISGAGLLKQKSKLESLRKRLLR